VILKDALTEDLIACRWPKRTLLAFRITEPSKLKFHYNNKVDWYFKGKKVVTEVPTIVFA
jgi:hypothetical protein